MPGLVNAAELVFVECQFNGDFRDIPEGKRNKDRGLMKVENPLRQLPPMRR
jgi:hypothetical protein